MVDTNSIYDQIQVDNPWTYPQRYESSSHFVNLFEDDMMCWSKFGFPNPHETTSKT